MKEELFAACDADSDGRLSSVEMRRLVFFAGVEIADDLHWEEEYQLLCEEWLLQPRDGITLAMCMHLLDDASDRGFYISDDELKESVASLEVLEMRGPNDGMELPNIWREPAPPSQLIEHVQVPSVVARSPNP